MRSQACVWVPYNYIYNNGVPIFRAGVSPRNHNKVKQIRGQYQPDRAPACKSFIIGVFLGFCYSQFSQITKLCTDEGLTTKFLESSIKIVV